MNYLYISIPVSLLLGIIILLLYLWAAKKGQFDDIEGPKYRMLDDDDGPLPYDVNPPKADKPDKPDKENAQKS